MHHAHGRRSIFPFTKLQGDDELTNALETPQIFSRDDILPGQLYRLEIIVRLHQSIRGTLPVRKVKFDDVRTC
jgi:hypothetical protein